MKLQYPANLTTQLITALANMGPQYIPRTEHLDSNGSPLFTNRLIVEDSPYLIQHAHNPVNWYPWGQEAFDIAQKENKPIFLSIGYSTCHWCHVMEVESFDSLMIANILNQYFIAIKVDREQRPDVDSTYMTAVQVMGQRGGWPLNNFLTPAGKPFMGGTYFPQDNFKSLLLHVQELWTTRQDEVKAHASKVAEAVKQATSSQGIASSINDNASEAAAQQINTNHDNVHGGFGDAPKFPNEPQLAFLHQYALSHGDSESLNTLLHSLTTMALGGIYDQVGGGFHRYSTDNHWLVPHFEKMLYNQAQLARLYTEAYYLTGNSLYERVAKQTLDYVIKEMTAPGGGFYSATDADSEGEEGLFFVWSQQEITKLLTPKDTTLALDIYNVTEDGNFEEKNILHFSMPIDQYAKEHGIAYSTLVNQVDKIRQTLYETRKKRIPPLRDDKVITAWNGMMIAAFAKAAHIFDNEKYLQTAINAANFLLKNNQKDNVLLRTYYDGSASITASHEDYAWFIDGLINIYDTSKSPLWLEKAKELALTMESLFLDKVAGGFFMGIENPNTPLIVRPKDSTDGAIPSSNAVAAHNLVQLYQRTGDSHYKQLATQTLASFATQMEQYPQAFPYMLMALDKLNNGDQSNIHYGAQGALRIDSSATKTENNEQSVELHLSLQPDWHINSDKPLDDRYIPTRVLIADNTNWRITAIKYPKPTSKVLPFDKEALSLIEANSDILISVKINQDPATNFIPLIIEFQACNLERCLLKEQLLVNVPIH